MSSDENILIDKRSDFTCMITNRDDLEIFHLEGGVEIALNNNHSDDDNNKANDIFYKLAKDFVIID